MEEPIEKFKILVIAALWLGSYYPIMANLWNIWFSVIPVVIGIFSLWFVNGSINNRMMKIFLIPLIISIGIAIYWIASSKGAEEEGLVWAFMIAIAPIGGFYVGSGIMAGLLYFANKSASNKSLKEMDRAGRAAP